MRWIYLSPHLDDVVLSLGGLIWEQTHAGEPVEIWTVFAGDPPPPPYTPFAAELHARWGIPDPQPPKSPQGAQHHPAGGTEGAGGGDKPSASAAAAMRRSEDVAACQSLSAWVRHGIQPDCIYRRLPDSHEPVIRERDDLFRPYPAGENYLVREIAAWIKAALAAGANLVGPMALGGHIDHRLVRAAAESLALPLFFYADYPYAVEDPLNHADLRGGLADYRPAVQQGLSPQAVAAWQTAIAAYTSQISTFWGSLDEMRGHIAAYCLEGGGSVLWRPQQNLHS